MVAVVVEVAEEEDEGAAEDLAEAAEVDPAVVFLAGRVRQWAALLRMAVRREVDLRRLAHDLQFQRRGQEVPVDRLFRMLAPALDQTSEAATLAQEVGHQFNPAPDRTSARVVVGLQTFQARV